MNIINHHELNRIKEKCVMMINRIIVESLLIVMLTLQRCDAMI